MKLPPVDPRNKSLDPFDNRKEFSQVVKDQQGREVVYDYRQNVWIEYDHTKSYFPVVEVETWEYLK